MERQVGEIFFRCWSSKQGGFWTSDSMSFKNIEGKYEWSLNFKNAPSHPDTTEKDEINEDCCINIFNNIGQTKIVDYIEKKIKKSQIIKFVGTGLNILEAGEIKALLINKAREGTAKEITICYGNPFSPHVQCRLLEEETGKEKPTVAYSGIIKRVKDLLRQTKDLPNIKVLLFNNYPTMAVFQFDEHFIYYPMGYRKLGNLCPVVCSTTEHRFGCFIEDMVNSYLKDAVSAENVLYAKEKNYEYLNLEEICQLATYIIPSNNSDFYKKGSQLIGYDYFNRNLYDVVDNKDIDFFRNYVGLAKDYGFHLTIGDVIYIQKNQVNNIINEIRWIARCINPFYLHINDVEKNYFWNNDIALSCSEESGNLEVFQSEIVSKINIKSLGSNYNFKSSILENLTNLSPRDKTMIEHYFTPNTLQNYKPHFTLCSYFDVISTSDLEQLEQIAKKLFNHYLNKKKTIFVDKVYILIKSSTSSKWEEISNERTILLGTDNNI